jgi:hypothetical protein
MFKFGNASLEAILSLFDSNLLDDPYQNFDLLLIIVKKAEKVICMDAFLGKISSVFIKIIENIKGKPIDFIRHYTVEVGVGKKIEFTISDPSKARMINYGGRGLMFEKSSDLVSAAYNSNNYHVIMSTIWNFLRQYLHNSVLI